MDDESASTRLLRAVLAGDDTFALRPEEPEEAWRIVEPVLERWREGDPPMQIYPVGASVADVVGRGAEPGGA
jgi:glucose-6-phosphate 1-dehydrogenase